MQRIQREIDDRLEKSATEIYEIKKSPWAKIFANVSLRSTTFRTLQAYPGGEPGEALDQTVYSGTQLVDVKISPNELNSRSESVLESHFQFNGQQWIYTTNTIYSFELP